MTATARIASLIQPTALSLLTRQLMDVLFLEIDNQKILASNDSNAKETQKAINSFYCNGEMNLFDYRFQNFDLSELNAICVNPQRETVESHSTVRSQVSATLFQSLFSGIFQFCIISANLYFLLYSGCWTIITKIFLIF